MRFTKLHINAIIGLFILAGLAAGMLAILLQNDLSENQFREVLYIIGVNIAGIVAVVKHFAGQEEPNDKPTPTTRQDSDKD